MLTGLYNTDILSLAASLQNTALTKPDGTARVVSKLCGSELEIDLIWDQNVIKDIAMRVKACALGQASAAILAESASGATREDIRIARDALYGMLKSGGAAPTGRFAKLALLADIANYPARHTSTLLAWDGALKAWPPA